jgi:DNA polymerase III epsilon subunit-like protein
MENGKVSPNLGDSAAPAFLFRQGSRECRHFSVMSWLAATIHVLDFEGSRRSGVVEYGVASLTGGVVGATHTRLCAPTGPVAAAETAAHGLRADDVAGLAPLAADSDRFVAWRQSGPWAAHHAPVERALLRRVWPVPPASPDFAAPEPTTAQRVADWGPWLDTRRLYERLHPGLANYQLAELTRIFGQEEELAALSARHCPPGRWRPHCALFDALAAALLLARLAREPALASASLAWLLTQSAPPAEEAAMRQGALEWEE